MLHFGFQELSRECLEEADCQCVGDAQQYHIPGWLKDNWERVNPKSYYHPSKWHSMTNSELVTCWHGLVEDYTRLLLTVETDIFPAISGPPKNIQQIRECRYLAGLWETSLLEDMLWFLDPWVEAGGLGVGSAWPDRPRTRRAPTWSWASVNGPTKYVVTETPLEPLCEILEVVFSPVGNRHNRGAVRGSHSVARVTDPVKSAVQGLESWGNAAALKCLTDQIP